MARTDDVAEMELAQFEPDPDGDGSVEPPAGADPSEPDDPQWIVFPDAADESDWAAAELGQIGAGWTPRPPVHVR